MPLKKLISTYPRRDTKRYPRREAKHYRYSLAGLLFIGLLVLTTQLLLPRPTLAQGPGVDTTVDENDGSCSDGDCSLRDAIALAAAGDTIMFAPALAGQTITLTTQVEITKALTIDGSTLASHVQISGSGSNERVFSISAAVTLTHLDIRHGRMGGNGGGLSVTETGNLTLNDCVVADNVATNSGGGLYVYGGSATINRSVFANNTALTPNGGGGGGLHNDGSVTVNDSVFSGNTTDYAGGGAYNEDGSTLIIQRSTFSGNTAKYGGAIGNKGTFRLNNSTLSGNSNTDTTWGGSALDLWGAGNDTEINHSTIVFNTAHLNSDRSAILLETGVLKLRNSIVAYNDGVYNFRQAGGTFVSQGYNLVNHWSGLAHQATDVTAAPLLAALADNGGRTQTHALLPGSPALDAANPAVSLTTDQRGVLRPQGGAPDIGAFEQWRALRLTKTATPAAHAPYHGLVTYTLVLSNSGALDAGGVRLTDTLPASVDFARWLVNPGASVAAGEITWNGTLAAATALTFTFQVTHTGGYGQVVHNTAWFSGPDERGSAAADFTVAAPFIAVSKAVTPAANAPYHGVVTYTLSVKNEGLADDPAARLTDTLPAEVDFARWLVNPGAAVLNDEITWSAPLAAGAALTFTFQVTHTGNSGDVVHNTAYGAGTAGGGSGSADFSVVCGPLITVQNTAEDGPGSLRYALAGVCPGGVVNFAPSLAGQIITLTEEIAIDKPLTLDGGGLSARVKIDGGGATRLFFIQDTAAVTMTQLILTRGYISDYLAYGGAIYNAGALTLQEMTFTDNQALQQGGAVYSYYGSRLWVSDSEFYRNRASIGGALYVYYDNTVAEVTGSVFMTNTASSSGGAIHNQESTLTITDSLIAGNQSDNDGGGLNIYDGVVTLAGCTIANNQADYGAGLSHNYGRLLITNTQILSNTAAGYGGALFDEMSDLTVNHSVIAGNTAHNSAGGLSLREGVTTISYSTLRDNRCTAGSGGALYNLLGNDLTLDHSTVTGNQAHGSGGGIFNIGSPLTVRYSHFTGNTGNYGGGLHSQSGTLRVTHSAFYSNTANFNGGGLNLAAGTAGITASILASNTASGGAGLYEEDGVLQVANSTLAGNGSAATLSGGGLTNNLGSLTLRHVTLAANTAITGGGLINMGGQLSAYNSLLAHNAGGDCDNVTLPGTIHANVNNLAADGSCGAALSGDPLLGLLADNGGETLTYGLLSGSPAIDAGDEAACLSTDQRGVARPQGARCDIGAFELVPPDMAVVGNSQVIADGDPSPSAADHTDFGSVALGGTLTRTFTISNSGGTALSLTGSPVVSLTGAGAGSFSVVVQPTPSISPNATAAFQVRFTASVTGTRVATVTIANNDSDENPYDFAIEGTTDSGIRPVYLPLIRR